MSSITGSYGQAFSQQTIASGPGTNDLCCQRSANQSIQKFTKAEQIAVV
jgi:hypothetical protein